MKRKIRNEILYKSRHIKRLRHIEDADVFMVAWSTGGREIKIFRGSLNELIRKIDDTIRIYGKWRYLI